MEQSNYNRTGCKFLINALKEVDSRVREAM
jgi:hypothetical protein